MGIITASGTLFLGDLGGDSVVVGLGGGLLSPDSVRRGVGLLS
jgi:hypothetical protein